jgi:hypothetical protein
MNAIVPNLVMPAADARPLVVHLVYALGVGGLETLLVDCINRMPDYRHAVVCLTRYTSFAERIQREDVELHALGKPPGLGLGTHLQFWRLMRRLRPTVLQTYNLAALEYNFSAAMAGVPVRIHAEHGRDASDPEGKNPKHNFLRRRIAPFIDRFIPVSEDLNCWLGEVVRIPAAKIQFIKNGVDTQKYAPGGAPAADSPWGPQDIVIGTVARVQDVKNHHVLVEALARLRAQLHETVPALAQHVKLTIVGDGPLLPAVRSGCRAHAPTSMPCCRRFRCSPCPRWPKARRCRCSKPWPAACRSWPRAWAASRKSWTTASRACWSRPATPTRWRRRCCAMPPTRSCARPTAAPGAHVWKSASACAPCCRPTAPCMTNYAGASCAPAPKVNTEKLKQSCAE